MEFLYVGQLWQGGTCAERMRTLGRLGVSALPFDVTAYLKMGARVERSVQSRLKIGRGISALNRALETRARAGGYDIVWVDKGVWLYPQTLDRLKAAARCQFAIHYTPDPQIVYHRSRFFFQCLPHYGLVVTTKPYELAGYREFGATELLLILQGYSQRFATVASFNNSSAILGSEVCFVGHCERHYANRISAAMTCTEDMAVWGPGWPRYARIHFWPRKVVHGDGLWGEDYPRALRSTKIALGLLSKFIPETTTTRTFEIPASGTFMLAERTDHHLNLFEEGREAEYFESDEELCDKIRFYLANDSARKSIAYAGRERCLRSNYADEHQLRRVLERLDEILEI